MHGVEQTSVIADGSFLHVWCHQWNAAGDKYRLVAIVISHCRLHEPPAYKHHLKKEIQACTCTAA